jgi:D-erythrulose 1-phosphate 3-epimerase
VSNDSWAQPTLGINAAFAIKRWPEAAVWLGIVADTLGVATVQLSCDQLDPRASPSARTAEVRRIRTAAERYGIRLHSVFAGLAAYSYNLLLHPDPAFRWDAIEWCQQAIELAAEVGASAFGGPLGAFSVRDAADPQRRAYLAEWEVEAIWRLAEVAENAGLSSLMWEPTPLAREIPSTIDEARGFLRRVNAHTAVPVRLCLDVGHACRPGAVGDDADPYAWIRSLGADAQVVHLQQTDGRLDRHWPFTPETAASGIITGERIVEALREARGDPVLILEIFHPFELPDEAVLADLANSVSYWKPYTERLERDG